MITRTYSKNTGRTEEVVEAKYRDFTPEQLKEMLQETEDKLIDLEIAFKARGLASQLHPKYAFHVIHADPQWSDGIENGIRIIGECTNEEEMDAHLHLYGQGPGWDKTIHSVVYYRMNGLLLHCHGGHLVLKAAPGDRFANLPIPCTDEQWDLLYSGIMPTELLSDYYTK